MTLTDFLLARIAEDEVWANARIKNPHLFASLQRTALQYVRVPPSGPSNPARVLAECEAKRRIVETASGWPIGSEPRLPMGHILRLLALPYADHPDYREEWKP